jgi:hypothetical protein
MSLVNLIGAGPAARLEVLAKGRGGIAAIERACELLKKAGLDKPQTAKIVAHFFSKYHLPHHFDEKIAFAAQLNNDWEPEQIDIAHKAEPALALALAPGQWVSICAALRKKGALAETARAIATFHAWFFANRVSLAKVFSTSSYGSTVQQWIGIASSLTGEKATADHLLACVRQKWPLPERRALAQEMNASAGIVDLPEWTEIPKLLTGANATGANAAAILNSGGNTERKTSLATWFNAEPGVRPAGAAPARPVSVWVLVDTALGALSTSAHVRSFAAIEGHWDGVPLTALVTLFAAHQRGRTAADWVAVANVLTGPLAVGVNVDAFMSAALTQEQLVAIATRFNLGTYGATPAEWAVAASQYGDDLARLVRHLRFMQAGWPATVQLNGGTYWFWALKEEEDAFMYDGPGDTHVTIHALYRGELPAAGPIKGPNAWRGAGRDFHVRTTTGLYEYLGDCFTPWRRGRRVQANPPADVEQIASDFWQRIR